MVFVFTGGLYTPAWANGQDDEHLLTGKKLFLHYCSHCHGREGDGEGFNHEYLDKEPADLTDEAFISKKKNEQLFNVIQNGGSSVRKSHLMPPFGKTLSEGEIWALVAYVRHLAEDDSNPVSLNALQNAKRSDKASVRSGEIASFLKWFSSEGKKPASIERGELLFYKRKSCLACHEIDGEGGRVGPGLFRSVFFYRPEWVYSWIRNPQAFRPNSKMPDLGLDEKEARDITAFLYAVNEEDEGIPEEWSGYLSPAGDPEQGKKVFFDLEGKARCAKCHRAGDQGGTVGPDLSFVGSSRTPHFLLESILDPKKVITAGFTAVLILTEDKKFITGLKKSESDEGLDIIDKEGRELHISLDKITKYKTDNISIMPEDFKEVLTEKEIKDVLAFLQTLTVPVPR